MVRNDSVIHIHGEQRHDERKQVDQERRNEHLAIDPPTLHDDVPEPVSRPGNCAVGDAFIEPMSRPRKNRVTRISLQQIFQFDLALARTGLRQNDLRGSRGVLAHQHTCLPTFKQQDCRQNQIRDSGERSLNQLRGQTDARCRTEEQLRRQPMIDQRQPGGQRIFRRRSPERRRQRQEASEQRVVHRARRRSQTPRRIDSDGFRLMHAFDVR